MSNFDGRIREYPNLFVDNFSASFLNLSRSQAFFLSHAHSDHMRGLDGAAFREGFLAHRRAAFFASAETKELLRRQSRYRRIAAAIVAVGIYDSFQVRLGRDESAESEEVGVTATFLPAQHCPGSVSIYFAGEETDRG